MSSESGEEAASTPGVPAPLPWHAATAAELLAQRDRLPHALLISGRAGIGKRRLAEWLARALVCESPASEGRPCGACPSCRYAAAAQHPDLRILEPIEVVDDEPRTVEWIVVERIRALGQWAGLTSHRRGAKVAIIDPAERMNAAAANALLKTLEEPPANTFFLLVTHQPGRLPATIVSRCRRIGARLPTLGEGLAWLEAQGIREDGAGLLAQANGAPLGALALASADYQAERRIWMNALASPRSLAVTALGARIDAGAREARRARLAGVVDWLIAWASDLARIRAGGTARHNPDFGAQLSTLAQSVAALPLFRYHRTLLEQRMLLAHPLQPRLVAEALLIDYRALFA